MRRVICHWDLSWKFRTDCFFWVCRGWRKSYNQHSTQKKKRWSIHTNTKYFIVHNNSCTSSALWDWNACESIFFHWRDVKWKRKKNWQLFSLSVFEIQSTIVHLSGYFFILICFAYNRNIVEMAQKKTTKTHTFELTNEWQ